MAKTKKGNKPAKRSTKTAKATSKKATARPRKKPPTHSRRANPNRTAILAEMNKTGATAQVMAKKYRVSAWTIYGWRKKKGGATGARRGRKPGRPAKGSATGITTASLLDEIRAALPGILREEIAAAVARLVGLRTGKWSRHCG